MDFNTLKDILNAADIQMEKEEKKRKEEEWRELERRLRVRRWEEEEKEEGDLFSDRGVYTVYIRRQVYTYQNVNGGGRVIVSIRSRQHSACTRCNDVSVKLHRELCEECDINIPPRGACL